MLVPPPALPMKCHYLIEISYINFINYKWLTIYVNYFQVLSFLESCKINLKEPKYSRQKVEEISNQLSDKEKNFQSLNTIVYEVSKKISITNFSNRLKYFPSNDYLNLL